MEFRDMVVAAIDKVVASGAIEQHIEKTIAKTVEEIISSELRSYGDFGKHITAAINQSMKLDMEKVDLPSYNDAVLKIIRKQVQSAIDGSLEKQVADNVAKLLQTPPKEIKLSDLVKDFIETLHSDEDCYCDGEQEITLIVEQDRPDFFHVYMDEDAGKTKYQCDIQLACHNGTVYSLRVGGQDTEKTLFVGPLFGFERDLFNLAVAKVVFVNDYDTADIVTTYGGYVD